jgi:protein-tyrosine phosphatase
MDAVDLHLHLLPAIDDGAADLDAALAHARRMTAAGVTEATVTPHVAPVYDVDVFSIPHRTAALQSALFAAGVELRLHPGGEVHPDRALGLSDDELDVVAHGPSGARWVLLEAPFAGIGRAFLEVCEGLRARGLGALVAHPERSAHGLELLGPNAVLQVNVDSLLGHHGPRAQRTAATLVRSGRAYVLGSDGHPGTREQTLGDGVRAAVGLGVPAEQARRLVADNPRFLLKHGLSSLEISGGLVEKL